MATLEFPQSVNNANFLGKRESKLRALKLGTNPEPPVGAKEMAMVLKNVGEGGRQVRAAVLGEDRC